MKRSLISIALLVVIAVLAYLLWASIQKPIEFDKERDKRFEATISRLKEIRKAQVAYKSEFGHYAAELDTLIYFIDQGQLNIEKQDGTYDPDDMSLEEAINDGLVTIVKTPFSVKDSLFKNIFIDSLRYVPYTNGSDQFEMDTASIVSGGLRVFLFEAKVHNDVLLRGMDKQLRINLNEEIEERTGFPGVRVGSLTESVNNAGNWE